MGTSEVACSKFRIVRKYRVRMNINIVDIRERDPSEKRRRFRLYSKRLDDYTSKPTSSLRNSMISRESVVETYGARGVQLVRIIITKNGKRCGCQADVVAQLHLVFCPCVPAQSKED